MESEYCSISANVTGVKFNPGIEELHSTVHVKLAKNPKDENSILTITQSGQVLGHLERKVAAVLAPILNGLVTKNDY